LFYENTLYKTIEQNGNSVTIQEYLTGDKMICNLDEIKESFIKFLAHSDKFIQPIIRTDYSKIIKIIGKKDKTVNTVLAQLLDNSIEFSIQGTSTRILSKPKVGSKVQINNINIIDNYELYDKSTRVFKVIESITKGKKIKYSIESITSDISLVVARESFKTLDVLDYKDLFTLD
jgi:hypothetical protein